MNTRIKIKKGLLQKSKKWYCGYCREFTKQIPMYLKNSEHIYKYNCLSCKNINYPDYYGCPECGAESNEDTFIETKNKRYDYAASMNYGSCYDWEEVHKCWNCGTIYEFTNSNC